MDLGLNAGQAKVFTGEQQEQVFKNQNSTHYLAQSISWYSLLLSKLCCTPRSFQRISTISQNSWKQASHDFNQQLVKRPTVTVRERVKRLSSISLSLSFSVKYKCYLQQDLLNCFSFTSKRARWLDSKFYLDYTVTRAPFAYGLLDFRINYLQTHS